VNLSEKRGHVKKLNYVSAPSLPLFGLTYIVEDVSLAR